jgi:hypothetical protein
MTISEVLDLATKSGGVGFWVLAAFALWKGWVVPGYAFRAEQRQRIFWQKTAWVALGLAKQTAPVPDFEFDREVSE